MSKIVEIFKCSKCPYTFARLPHLEKYNKRICNVCCDTAEFKDGIFQGCFCGAIESDGTELSKRLDALERTISPELKQFEEALKGVPIEDKYNNN